MSDFQIRRIPVCDSSNKIVGILSLGDLAHFDDSVGKNEVCNTLENICECGNNSKNAE
jgi:CBS-domain-containing membrane protein